MDGFIGEIRLMALNFTPVGWLPCAGQTLQVQQYQALYAVIGNIYGGTGPTTFAAPNLVARVAVGAGDDPTDTFDPAFGSNGGANSVTLTNAAMPSHTHTMVAAVTGVKNRVAAAQGNWLGGAAYLPTTGTTTESAYAFAPDSATADKVPLNAGTLSPYNGTGGPHENRQPYLALQYCICATEGVFPVRP